MVAEVPAGYVLARTTPTFDSDTVPAGLLAAHRIADGVWGRLLVHTGSLHFVFEDRSEPIEVEAGGTVVIPPNRPHHLVIDGAARFAVEFYRPPSH